MAHSKAQRMKQRCRRKIKNLIPQFGLPPEEINNGACGLFSSMVVEMLGGPTDEIYESMTDGTFPGHCWITCHGLHFDAECVSGVEDPHDLPWFKRTGIRIINHECSRTSSETET